MVEFELADGDLERFRTWSWTYADKPAPYTRFWWFAGLAALVGTAVMTALGLPLGRDGAMVCIGLFAAYLLGISDAYLASTTARRTLVQKMRSRWPTRIEIGEEGIAAHSAAGRMLYFWPTITRVDHWDGLLLIAAGNSAGFPVNVRHVWPDDLAAMIDYCRARYTAPRALTYSA